MPLVYDHLPTAEPGAAPDKGDFPYYEGAWAFITAGAVVRLWKSDAQPRRLVGTGRYDLLPSGPDEPIRIQMWFASSLGSHSVPVQLELLSL